MLPRRPLSRCSLVSWSSRAGEVVSFGRPSRFFFRLRSGMHGSRGQVISPGRSIPTMRSRDHTTSVVLPTLRASTRVM